MQTIAPSKSSVWDETISEQKDVTIFHSSAWAKVIEDTYGHRSRLHVCSDGSVLPLTEIKSPITGKRGHCVPFADRCAILGGAKKIPTEVIEFAENRAWKTLEIRGENGIPNEAPASASYLRHSIRLDSETEKSFSQSARRAVRKAERSDLEAKIPQATDSLGIERYFKLHTQTRRRHGLPPQPVRFFHAIQRHIIAKRLGFIVEVEDRRSSKVVASAVFFQLGDTAFYKFGASDSAAWSLRPNNLLFAHAIKYLCANDKSSALDLGRSDLADSELHRFKRGWGAEEFPLNYYNLQISDKSWVIGSPSEQNGDKMHNRIFRALPPLVNRLAGSLLYPHLS